MAVLQRFYQRLERPVFDILKEHKKGISEFELLKLLEKKQYLRRKNSTDSHNLFRLHFILFHTLYRLRQRLLSRGKYDIEIHTVKIKIIPSSKNKYENSINTFDNLADYYLDESNLKDTTPADVEELLNSFFSDSRKFTHRHKALNELGLSDPVSSTQIKKRYRELARAHHPDAGGSTDKMSKITAAFEVLS